MFEALRGLRDAVAPESGNLGGNGGGNASTTEPDVEELWQAYCNGDEAVTALVQRFSINSANDTVGGVASGSTKVIQKRSDFVAWYAVMEREKDKELVERLAAAVLLKSDEIEDALLKVPGLNRTRTEQLSYIEELIAANAAAADELESVYEMAIARRERCRQFVRKHTSEALGIEEEV
jgi:hypothetical protein